MTSNRFERITNLKALSLFITAGYPRRDDTLPLIVALQRSDVDFVEVGFPFSDPVADGPTIQESNQTALANGMTVERLFEQLSALRTSGVTLPLLLMGYLNPVERFGRERFFERASECGVDGFILPDMPFDEYLSSYKALYQKYGIKPVFLITSRTEAERIHAFDQESPAFLYVVSSDAVTGGKVTVTNEREAFYKRLSEMNLRSRLIVGFGVSDRDSFNAVTKHSSGAIIASAFLRALRSLPLGTSPHESESHALDRAVSDFVKQVR